MERFLTKHAWSPNAAFWETRKKNYKHKVLMSELCLFCKENWRCNRYLVYYCMLLSLVTTIWLRFFYLIFFIVANPHPPDSISSRQLKPASCVFTNYCSGNIRGSAAHSEEIAIHPFSHACLHKCSGLVLLSWAPIHGWLWQHQASNTPISRWALFCCSYLKYFCWSIIIALTYLYLL